MIVSYGKKPRKSKTSEIIEIDGLSFYLYNTKTSTKGITEIYLNDNNIYPLIKVAMSNEKAKLWLSSNITRVKAKLFNLSSYGFINRDEFTMIKPEEKEVTKNITMPTMEELQQMHNRIIGELDI